MTHGCRAAGCCRPHSRCPAVRATLSQIQMCMLFELRAAARGRFLFTKGARREHRGAMLLSSRVAGYLPANKPALVEENVGSSE